MKPYTRAEVEAEAWFGGQKERVLDTVAELAGCRENLEATLESEVQNIVRAEKAEAEVVHLKAEETIWRLSYLAEHSKVGEIATERDLLKARIVELEALYAATDDALGESQRQHAESVDAWSKSQARVKELEGRVERMATALNKLRWTSDARGTTIECSEPTREEVRAALSEGANDAD